MANHRSEARKALETAKDQTEVEEATYSVLSSIAHSLVTVTEDLDAIVQQMRFRR